MNPMMLWDAEISDALSEQEDANLIKMEKEWFHLPFDDKTLLAKLPTSIQKLYKYANGVEIRWHLIKDSSQGGRIHFLNYETAFLTVNKYDDWQIEQEETLPYFRAIDLITDEAECGIIYNGKEYLGDTMFYLERGDANLQSLNINFDGYLELLKMSRGYYYWPKALLDIERGTESFETKNFKQNMPLIFEDFNWDEFVEKYQALRLSTKG